MLSKTWSSELTLWRKDLRRFWPLWSVYLLAFLVSGAIPFLSQLNGTYEKPDNAVFFDLLFDVQEIFLPMIFVVSAPSAMAVFSYLYHSRSCNAAACLPISRSGQFFAHYLAGLTWMLAAPLLSGAVMLVATLCSPVAAGADVLVQLCIVLVLSSFAFYTFACFCAMLTGNGIVLPLVYLVLSVVFPLAEELTQLMCSHLIYGLTSGSNGLLFLSPLIYLERRTSFDYEAVLDGLTGKAIYNSYPYLLFLTLFSVGILFLAVLLYRRRQMESAGDVVAVGFLKPVFRYTMAAGCALVVGCIPDVMYNSSLLLPVLWVLMLIGAFLGYFGSEMLMQKSFRVFSHWRGYAVVAAVSAALVLMCAFDLFGVEHYQPGISDIQAAEVYVNGTGTELQENDSLKLLEEAHSRCIAQEKDPEEDQETELYLCEVSYTLKNGRYIHRKYRIPVNDALIADPSSVAYALNEAINCPEAVKVRKDAATEIRSEDIMSANLYYNGGDTSTVASLTKEQAVKLYQEGVLQDLEEGTIGRVWFWGGSEYKKQIQASIELYIVIRATDSDGDEYTWDYDTYILPGSQHSRECLRQMNLLP